MSEADLLNQLNAQFTTLEQRIQDTFDIFSATLPVASGPIGNTGTQGIQGPIGPIGQTGRDGPTGPLGGPVGPTGSQGIQGIQGPIGPIGSQGLIGRIGNQGIQGPIGPIGNQGPIGLGSQGFQGSTGQTGTQGSIGVQGPIGLGAQGYTGTQGTRGLTGFTGAQGYSQVGSTGSTGPMGSQGIKGDLGGSFTWKGIYNPTTSYSVNDTFFYQGSSYIYSTSPPTPFAITTLTLTGVTSFNYPSSIVVKSDGTIFVADNQNHLIKKITAGGLTSIYAGSTPGYLDNINPTLAQFKNPYGLALDSLGNLYVADRGNNMIRKISTAGIVTTVAGQLTGGAIIDQPTTQARFNSPSGLAVDSAFNIYVADTNNNAIRLIDPAGNVTTYAGNQAPGYVDGIAGAARFFNPIDVALDSTGTILYVADTRNHLIRKITSGGNVVSFAGTIAGGYSDGISNNSGFNLPYSLSVDSVGNIFVADNGNNCIRQITSTGSVTTIAGNITLAPDPYNRGLVNGTGIVATFYNPSGIAIDINGNLYIADTGNQVIRKGTPTGAATGLSIMTQKGEMGSTGAQGFTGQTGQTGFTGTQGATGAQGVIGTQGATGAQGFTGSTGNQGFTGSQGYTGTQGYIGMQGSTGAQGYTGTQGSIGVQGPAGIPGPNTGYTGATGAGPYTNQGYFSISNGVTPQTVTLNAGTSVNPVFWLNATGVYNISIFSYINGTYFFATLGVYKTSSGFQSVYMGVTSFQITLNLVSGPIISASVTITGVVNGNYYWSIALSAPYTLSIT